ncbi:ATP-dependent RNA helicase dbp3 [Xylogone sp. PMI_703]|nr:ATP-dependent RNA helicase dbp3 [Xylogone sp. PMI_703]
MKRTLEDAELAIGGGSAVEILPKKSKKTKLNGLNSSDSKDTSSAERETKSESKEERRERRRLKKLAKQSQKNTSTDAEEDTQPREDEDLDTEDAKKAKKARKAELKALKKAKKQAQGEHGDASESEIKNSGVSTPISVPDSYVQDPRLVALPQQEIDQFLADNFITITDPLASSTTLRPLTKFEYLPKIATSNSDPFKDFKSPTPIQAAAWPFLLARRDVIGVAETGSGKTMAFSVPCIQYITSIPKAEKRHGAKAVVVSPTRELAMQIYEQITKLAKAASLQTVCVYGGVPKDEQRKALKTADIVIATPGRLNDLIGEGCADLSRVRYVVLDEADRMLDKGFEEEIKKIISSTLPIGERQTLMFTATWPESVRSLAETFMNNPIKINIGDNPTGDLRANNRIVQRVEVMDPRDKEYRLVQVLKQYQSGHQQDDRIIVFCLYKKEATRVENFIRAKGFRVAGIHGDLSQEQRTRSLEAFKTGKTPILVATDVAARGLDIPAVKLVLNYTFPLTVDDYVHRIGRTGRAGKDGLAITFFTEHDKAHSGSLINVLKGAKQPVPDELLKFGTTVKRKGHDAYGAFFKEVDSTKKAQKIKFD